MARVGNRESSVYRSRSLRIKEQAGMDCDCPGGAVRRSASWKYTATTIAVVSRATSTWKDEFSWQHQKGTLP